MAYMTILAVVEVPDEEVPKDDDPDERLELGMKQFKDQEKIRFITMVRGVTVHAMMEGADPSMWPEDTVVGSF